MNRYFLKHITASLYIMLVLFSCEQTNENNEITYPDSLQFVTNIDPDIISFDPSFAAYKPEENPLTPNLTEVSGIVQSVTIPNSFWLHEDSGSEAVVYLYSGSGERLQKYKISEITKYDYEDISIGLSPNRDYNHIYLGDIGDNFLLRQNIIIHSFPEPNYASDPNKSEITSGIESYTFVYPDGAHNSEAFFLEPKTGDLYIFTKLDNECKVYTSSFPFDKFGTNDLKLIGMLNIKGDRVNAADISKNGDHIVIKTTKYLFYWNRDNGEPLNELFKILPTKLPYTQEPQGEAVCWKGNAESYITVSENNSGIETKFIQYKD